MHTYNPRVFDWKKGPAVSIFDLGKSVPAILALKINDGGVLMIHGAVTADGEVALVAYLKYTPKNYSNATHPGARLFHQARLTFSVIVICGGYHNFWMS